MAGLLLEACGSRARAVHRDQRQSCRRYRTRILLKDSRVLHRARIGELASAEQTATGAAIEGPGFSSSLELSGRWAARDNAGCDGAGGGRDHDQPAVEEVFDFVADERNEPRYNARMVRAEQISEGPIGEGTRFRTELRAMGRAMAMVVVFTDYERPSRLASVTSRR